MTSNPSIERTSQRPLRALCAAARVERLGSMGTVSSFIRITQVPAGEAPLSVREKWVGLTLPLAPSFASPTNARTFGVLSGPRRPWARVAAVLLGRTTHHRGYAVEASLALEALHRASPEAAAWWRENTPHMLSPGQHFLFPENCGHVVPS
jgi:hypothetical protein